MIFKKCKNLFGISASAWILIFFFCAFLLPVFSVSATDYVPLAPITGTLTPGANTTNLSTYLLGIFKVGIAVAGVLAFLMIVLGGFQYLSTDAIMGKEEGKQRITRALGGLVLALAAYIILYTINPNLVNLNLNFGPPARAGVDLAAPSTLSYQQQLDNLINQTNKDVDARIADASALKTQANAIKESMDNALAAGAIDPATYDAAMLQVTSLQTEADALSHYRSALENFGTLQFAGIQNVKTDNRSDIQQTLIHINSKTATDILSLQADKSKDPANASKYDKWIAEVQAGANATQVAIAQAAIQNGGSNVAWVVKTAMDSAYQNNNQNLLTTLRATCSTSSRITWCNSYLAHP